MYSEYEQYEEHPNFKITPVGDHYQLHFVDSLGLVQERFGLYSRWWMAEREARKYQAWCDAEAF